MKRTILILAVLFTGGFVKGQKIDEADVPTVVKATFSVKYPAIAVDKWGEAKDGYLAVFNQNDYVVYVTITPRGDWIRTQTQIDTEQLPKAAFDYIKKNYPDKKISEAYQIDHSSGPVTFQVVIDGHMILTFDAIGGCMTSEKKIR